MSSFDPTSLLQRNRLQKSSGPTNTSTPIATTDQNKDQNKPDAHLASLLQPAQKLAQPLNTAPLSTAEAPIFQQLRIFINQAVALQLRDPTELLKLNQTRRESLGRFLSELARHPEPADPQLALRTFLSPNRSAAENAALEQLYHQILVVYLGKVLLLRNWALRGLVRFDFSDLRDLNAALDRALKPKLSLAREAWQITSRNFFSWFRLPSMQEADLWNLLEHLTPSMNQSRQWLLNLAIETSAKTLGERDRYSKNLYHNVWKSLTSQGLIQEPQAIPGIHRSATYAYSPTLRDGTLVEESPQFLEWIGFESLNFELIFGEIRSLWNQPDSPHLWAKGTGLEMSMEPQSYLGLPIGGNSGGVSTIDQIDQIASCEIAWISEENIIRTQGKSMASSALRNKVEGHNILKKLKSANATRGMYQACQAIDKLRNSGLLIWVREELLNDESGRPILQQFIADTQILMIADLTNLSCENAELKRDIPKAFYVLRKEASVEARRSHRPVLVKAYGSIHDPKDGELLFDRLIKILTKPETVFPAEPFALHARLSPVSQMEWENHWLNPADDQWVDRIEHLKRNSETLANLATVRMVHDPKHTREITGDEFLLDLSKHRGFWAWATQTKEQNQMHTASNQVKMDLKKFQNTPLFFIAPTLPEWNASLEMLLRSSSTVDWLNYHAERKRGAWILKDSDLKAIPVPQVLAQALKGDSSHLHPNEMSILDQIAIQPSQVLQQISMLSRENTILRGFAFIRAASTLSALEVQEGHLFSMFNEQDQLHMKSFLDRALSPRDTVTLDRHPAVRIVTPLPDLFPVTTLQTMKQPNEGFRLFSQRGFAMQILIADPWLRQVIEDQMQELMVLIKEPTWADIKKNVRVPHPVDVAKHVAAQITQNYQAEKMRRKELRHFLSACLAEQDVGLLQ